MALFKYVARSTTGQKTEGVIEAADRRHALLHIERLGGVPISVAETRAPAAAPAAPAKAAKKPDEAPPPAPARERDKEKKPPPPETRKPDKKGARPEPAKAAPILSFGRKRVRMSMHDMLLFTSELADLLAAGMQLGTALNALARRQTNKPQDVVVVALRDDIIQGASLSEALSKWPGTFPTLYISMVRAGEAAGAITQTLQGLQRHYERVQEAREKVMMALIYPAVIICLGIGTLIFAMVFVMPKFTQIFAELGNTMPLPTRIMIGLSKGLTRYGWLVALAAVGGFFLFKRAINTREGRRWWDGLLLRMPVARNIVAANAFAHFARTLGALMTSGVPVLQALTIVENTVGNALIAEEIHSARDRVTDGSSISGPLAASRVFPPLLTDMLRMGEETGDMPGALEHIARRYDGELDRSVKIMTTLMEPALIVVVGGLVGFVAISMLMAVFEVTSGLQN